MQAHNEDAAEAPATPIQCSLLGVFFRDPVYSPSVSHWANAKQGSSLVR
jgi:hypothetical protein